MSAAKPKLRVLQRDPSVTSSSSVTTATTTTAAMRRPQVAASATSEPVTKVLRQPRQANATNGFEARSDCEHAYILLFTLLTPHSIYATYTTLYIRYLHHTLYMLLTPHSIYATYTTLYIRYLHHTLYTPLSFAPYC